MENEEGGQQKPTPLVRLQARLTYQLIGLSIGDVRRRIHSHQ